MTLFDLCFLVGFLASVATLVTVSIRLLTRRPVARMIIGLLAGWAVYTLVLLSVSILAPQRNINIGAAQCSDDWCLSLAEVDRVDKATGIEYTLGLNISNRGKGRSQRERFVSVYLVLENGQRVEALPAPTDVPFDTLVTAGQSIRATRHFQLPPNARAIAMIVARQGWGRFPRCCIIDEDNSFLHKPTYVRLESH